ncbi:MAG: hypothetical protein SGILL_001815 [Bacillariaceae sp.]
MKKVARSTHSRSIMDEQSHALDGIDDSDSDLLEETVGDFDAYRKEWTRLIKDKKSWKNKLATSRARNTLLSQQVDDLTAERTATKSRIKRSEAKATKLVEQQRADRAKVDNSTDLVVQTRVELTKTTNDNAKLKSRIFELESSLVTKDRLVEDVNETVERQAEIIETLSNKLKDTETTKRLMDDEKRRLEDEVAVLIAKSDGEDMRETFQQLEQEREKFFWQKEMDMEQKRVELESWNDRHLKQEKARHDKEMARIAEDEERKKQIEENRESIQEIIAEQLEDLKEGNRRIRDQFERDRTYMNGEVKEKEREITLLERDILEMQKQLSVIDRSKKDVELAQAKAADVSDDLRDMRRHKLLLEKEIAKLKKKKGTGNGSDWREIIFPGYRGVSFGSKEAESLAGFLTILVEEHGGKKGKKSRKSKRSSIDLSEILEHESSKRKRKKLKRDTSSSSREYKKKKKKKKSSEKRKAKKGRKDKKNSYKKKKSHKHSKKKKKNHHHHKSKRKGDVYLDNSLTLDENLDLMWRLSRNDRKSGNVVDDMSMLVFKNQHKKKRRSRSARPSTRDRHRDSRHEHRRRSRSNPPAQIVLQ